VIHSERLKIEPHRTPALVKIDHPPTIAARSNRRQERSTRGMSAHPPHGRDE
jgi:hypothetical protein